MFLENNTNVKYETTEIETEIETQNALIEKFNTAFYEAQRHEQTNETLLEDYNYFDNAEENAVHNDNNNFLLDFLIARDEKNLTTNSDFTTISSDDTIFDYQQFAENFERAFINDNFNNDINNRNNYVNNLYGSDESPFFIPLPFNTNTNKIDEENLEDFDISDADLCDNLSNSSIDFENINTNFLSDYEDSCYIVDEQQQLPPINTIRNNNIDFMNFIRSTPADCLNTQIEVCTVSFYSNDA